MVDFPEPDGPTNAVTVPGLASKEMPCRTVLAGLIGEFHILKEHFADNVPDLAGALRIFILGTFTEDLSRSLEARQRLTHLRSDIDDADDRRDQENADRR